MVDEVKSPATSEEIKELITKIRELILNSPEIPDGIRDGFIASELKFIEQSES